MSEVGESTNEGWWRGGSVYTFSTRGAVCEEAPHVCSLLTDIAESRQGKMRGEGKAEMEMHKNEDSSNELLS